LLLGIPFFDIVEAYIVKLYACFWRSFDGIEGCYSSGTLIFSYIVQSNDWIYVACKIVNLYTCKITRSMPYPERSGTSKQNDEAPKLAISSRSKLYDIMDWPMPMKWVKLYCLNAKLALSEIWHKCRSLNDKVNVFMAPFFSNIKHFRASFHKNSATFMYCIIHMLIPSVEKKVLPSQKMQFYNICRCKTGLILKGVGSVTYQNGLNFQ